MRNIIIVGAGGFASEIYGYLHKEILSSRLLDCHIRGFLVDDKKHHEQLNVSEPYLGKIKDYSVEQGDELLVAIGENPGRKTVIRTLVGKGCSLFTYIHSGSFVDFTARIGNGVIVCPNCMVNANVRVGDYSLLNIYSSIGHDSMLGKNSILSPYSTLNGRVVIGDNSFLGTHSTVLPRLSIGENCIIAAGAVVSKNMSCDTLAFPSTRTTYKKLNAN